ncbi:MAG: hypothetical protein MJA31_11685 [Clostridia bacterium]|nr:hypothetical protein [Clostridia bacterium]
MIYISFAFFKEAEPYIHKYQLKKNMNIHPFSIYYNSYMTIIITGMGVINAGVCTTYMLSNFEINDEDIFANIGICGSNHKEHDIRDVVLCNKIIQSWDEKCRYPDILYQHPFIEGSVETFMNVVEECTPELKGDTIEMEAAGMFRAASVYFPLHRMFFIKIISDKLHDVYDVTDESVYDLMNSTSESIVNWLVSVHNTIKGCHKGLSDVESDLLAGVKENMNLTENMYEQLIKLVVYYKSRQGTVGKVIQPYLDIKINSKNERKKYFEELRNKLKDV